MDEEKKTEPDIIIKAREEREKLKAENDRLEKNIKELRELEAHKQLSGNTGNPVQTEKVIETPREYRKRIMREVAEGKYDAPRREYTDS